MVDWMKFLFSSLPSCVTITHLQPLLCDFAEHLPRGYGFLPHPLVCDNVQFWEGFPDGSVVKSLPANAGDTGDMSLIPGPERSPGEGNCNPLQYCFLENPMDRGAWRATVHRVTQSHTRLSHQHFHFTLSWVHVNLSTCLYLHMLPA